MPVFEKQFMKIFEPRIAYKPFEYPELLNFVEAINKQFWVHSEVDFTADHQDFKTNLTEIEKEAIKRSLLCISQIEVSVKTFWGNLYNYFPKPEFYGLGSTFAESEFRHSQAYSKLLEVLGYNREFEKLIEIPVIKNRIEILGNALKNAKSKNKKEYVLSLILFSVLIENVSLFSQFATILSFTRFKGYLKNTSNIIAWTSVDEQIHAQAGIYIVNLIKKECPEIFDENFIWEIKKSVIHSLKHEEKLLRWIFEKGALEHLSKKMLMAFLQDRANSSLKAMGIEKIFFVSDKELQKMNWFYEEIHMDTLDDFFAKRPVDYTKHDKPISANDLF